MAAKVLDALDISLERAREVEEIIGHGGQAPSGHIPFTPRAKKVLELSLREALQLGHDYIGTEHILLGLIREGEGVAAQVLVKLGADLARVRQAGHPRTERVLRANVHADVPAASRNVRRAAVASDPRVVGSATLRRRSVARCTPVRRVRSSVSSASAAASRRAAARGSPRRRAATGMGEHS